MDVISLYYPYSPYDPFSMVMGMMWLVFIIPIAIGIIIIVLIVRAILNMDKKPPEYVPRSTMRRDPRYTQTYTPRTQSSSQPTMDSIPETPAMTSRERAASSQDTTPISEGETFCPNCGAKIKKDDAFCIDCGRYLGS